MLGNIWLSSALIVTAIFSAGAMYKSFSDVQEAKQIQESYQILSDIKILLAKQYNKNPDEISRDEIIAHLPKGENWEKVLLLDRNSSSNLSNNAMLTQEAKINLSADEKLKLLALKAKLKDVIDVNNLTSSNGKYTFEVGQKEKNKVIKDIDIEKDVTKAIDFLATEILYSNQSVESTIAKLKDDNNEMIPYLKLYFEFLKIDETTISDDTLKARRQEYFIQKIKDRLYKNESAIETKLYNELDGKLWTN